jgi:hypothetical protein
LPRPGGRTSAQSSSALTTTSGASIHIPGTIGPEEWRRSPSWRSPELPSLLLGQACPHALQRRRGKDHLEAAAAQSGNSCSPTGCPLSAHGCGPRHWRSTKAPSTAGSFPTWER